MTRLTIILGLLCIHLVTTITNSMAAEPTIPKLVSVKKIWDKAPHNAFTDLIRFKDRWYCVFREGKSHASPDGALRVITSVDGTKWESSALITSATSDLRDAKLSITPDGRLMLAGAEAVNQPITHKHQSLVWFSGDGKKWSNKYKVGNLDNWLWRISWHQGKAYGFGYGTGKNKGTLNLYESKDGKKFDTLINKVDVKGTYPNESSMVFLKDGTCYCLLRQDGKPKAGLIGASKPPYKKWSWKKLSARIGGPDMLHLPDGRLIAAVRLYDKKARTSLCWVDPKTGNLTECLKLPSGGDTSYPGLVWHNDLLWVSYYSSHEKKTSIYLAKVKFVKAGTKQTLDIGSRRELFVDHYLIDKMKNTRLVLNHPRDEGIVHKFDKPWEGLFAGYCTVIHDGPVYRLYYRGMPKIGHTKFNEVTCYAESKDGIHWKKPELGLFKIQGSSKNNVIMAQHRVCHNFSPFIDKNPKAKKSQRYKALGGTGGPGLIAFTSPDGIHWKEMQKKPVFSKGYFDSQNVSFWSETEKRYVCYFRVFVKGIRRISRTTSVDFLHWTEPVLMEYRNKDSKVQSEHHYTNQTHPYFRAPHLYVSLAARFMPGQQVLTTEQAKAINVNPSYFKDTSDAIFMTTRGGRSYYNRTFLGGFVRPGIGAHNWVSRTNYPALNVVQTSPTEMSLYLNQDYAQPTAHLRRYSLRLDGFASVQAEYAGGEMITKPITFDGKQLTINFSTSAAGSIRVEIQDEAGKPIPGYTLKDARAQIGNEIERVVTWKNGADLSKLAGKPIRLRFVIKDANLFALKFNKEVTKK